jgi:hypothetical protein
MTLAQVSGIAPGISAHVSASGYIPAVPVEAPGEMSQLFVLWLDSAQLQALDETEPNYWRRELPSSRFPVDLSGVRIPSCYIYVGKHGCLIDPTGKPRRLTNQQSLIEELLAESSALRDLCGTTAQEFIVCVRNETVRRAVKQLFITQRRTAAQPALDSLPTS